MNFKSEPWVVSIGTELSPVDEQPLGQLSSRGAGRRVVGTEAFSHKRLVE